MYKKVLLSSAFIALFSLNVNAQNSVNDPFESKILNEFTANGLTDYITNVGSAFVYSSTDGNYQANLGPSINDKKYLFWGVQSQINTLSNFTFTSNQLQPNQKFIVRAKVHAPTAGEDNVDLGIHVTNFENLNAIENPTSFPANTGIKTFLGPEYNLIGVNTATTYQFDITPILPHVANRYACVVFKVLNKTEGEKTVIIDDLEFGLQPVTTASSDSFFKQNFTIYPNPVLDVLNIASSNNMEILNVMVLDLNGRIIKSVTGSQINVSDLAFGTYVLNIQSDKGIATTKFIKKYF